MSRVFSEIHLTNAWGHAETVSGPGSSLENTATLRRALPSLVTRYGLKRVVDAPCGDFNWMKTTVDIFDEYTASISSRNSLPPITGSSVAPAFASNAPISRATICLRATSSSAATASYTCRPGSYGMPSAHSGARALLHLLLSNNSREFEYQEIPTGGLRQIDSKAAVQLPEPLETILEDNYEGRQICLWRLDEIG